MPFSTRHTHFFRYTLPHSQTFHHLCRSAVFVLAPRSTISCTTNTRTFCSAASPNTTISSSISVLASSVIRKQTLSSDPALTRTAFKSNSRLGQPFRRTLSAVPMARQSSHSLHSSPACRAYVGEATPAAGEYHCNDFEWEDLRQEAEALLSARKAHQQDGRSAAAASQPSDLKYNLKLASKHVDANLPQQQQQQQQQNECSISPEYDKGCWEAFHARDNATARFYKERRYLLLEFPCLTISQPPQHFMEIGCGCGSSLLPVLKANPTCTVTGTDLSPTAVDMFKRAAVKAGIGTHRFTGYAADSTQADAVGGPKPNSQGSADAALLIFTLAAVTPEEMPAMLHTAFQALCPGGVLLIRDHGLYDLTHLRLPPQQQLADRLYRRLDGTTCYFFTTEDLQTKAETAGFVTRECKYACTNLLNRKKQINMKRVFVHGVFEKPHAVANYGANA